MPEYLAPGVYIEETSFRSKSIEGVSTTTTGFVGPTRYGPVNLPLEVVTSLGDFVQTYGDGSQLTYVAESGSPAGTYHNYIWHGVRAFFEEGGKRLYVARIFQPLGPLPPAASVPYATPDDKPALPVGGQYVDGHGRAQQTTPSTPTLLNVRARYPGSAGNVRTRIRVDTGANVLSYDPAGAARVAGLVQWDVVLIGSESGSPLDGIIVGELYTVSWDPTELDWHFTPAGAGGMLKLKVNFPKSGGREIRQITLGVSVLPLQGAGISRDWKGLAPDSRHQMNGAGDSVRSTFGWFPETPSRNKEIPIVFPDPGTSTGVDFVSALFTVQAGLADSVKKLASQPADRTTDIVLSGGNDGGLPQAGNYEGEANPGSLFKTGLKQLEDIDDISIIAAPGYSYNYAGNTLGADTITSHLIDHCNYMRYRIAVLDSGNGLTLNEVQKQRGKFDSSWGALYYPWVEILDPITRLPIYLPPSGFVAGIYARNDVNRAVYKAPANEVVNLALGFEKMLNKAQQDILNPIGINCFRFFEGRGNRLWGARTISSDPEWKYVNLRRYFAYLEHSIDRGTQWAVFEPNSELLWGNIRRTIQDFLFSEWQGGAYVGDKPETSYFVRCDRSTMNQNDLDNGRLVCLIGVAVVKPAEFVIFRIGQWTADSKK